MNKKIILGITNAIVVVCLFLFLSYYQHLSCNTPFQLRSTKTCSSSRGAKQPSSVSMNNAHKPSYVRDTNIPKHNEDIIRYIGYQELSNAMAQSPYTKGYMTKKAELFFRDTFFTNGSRYRIDDFMDRLVCGESRTGSSEIGFYYIEAVNVLRYRVLIPHAAQQILAFLATNDVDSAYAYISWLSSIEHPDSLRTHLLLNALIASNSPFRQGTNPLWKDCLPFYNREDCLPIYVEIVQNPYKYTWNEWATAHDALMWFTNQIAVDEYKNGIDKMVQWQQYWPEHRPSMDIVIARNRMEVQHRLLEGTEPMRAIPKPLLDE